MMCYVSKNRTQYSTLHLPGKRESDDVWNIQKEKSNFQYGEIYINFMRQSFKKDNNVNITRKINIRKNII
jgi:hypothetical protein